MATELGVGVRVYVGWVPPHESVGYLRALACCKQGTITDGPARLTTEDIGSRVLVLGLRWMRIKYPATYWAVRMDNGHEVGADERYLFPIDDGDEAVERDERETDHMPA